MYAKNAMGGTIDPYINVIFSPIQGDEPQIVSLVVFAWADALDVGVPEDDGFVIPYLTPLLTYCRECIFVIRHPFKVDCVHKTILENS